MGNILIIGAKGQLGSEFGEISLEYDSYNFSFVDIDELDITNKQKLNDYFENNRVDIIINCAAYTAVDKAETEYELADKINHIAVRNLAEIAKRENSKLVHFSTDYVFDGRNYKPYTEDDSTNPQGVYGLTKLNGEKALMDINPHGSIIIRTSWVYSSFGNNFVKTMLRLGEERDELNVIYDQIGSPTYARDLAKAVMDILPQLNNSDVAIFNYSNEGVLSWYDFAIEIMKNANLGCSIMPIETKDYPTPAKRPHCSLLNKTKIKNKFNLTIPYWKDSLKECLDLLID